MKASYYKIVEDHNGSPKTLFHGVSGVRTLPFDTWVDADIKWVNDGDSDRYYWSGFHLLETLEEAIDYLRKFKRRADKAIVKVTIDTKKKLWRKTHSPHNVWLAETMKISKRQWDKRKVKILPDAT